MIVYRIRRHLSTSFSKKFFQREQSEQVRRVKPVGKPFRRSGLAANRQAGEHDRGRGEYAHAELHAEERVAVPIRRPGEHIRRRGGKAQRRV